MKAGRGRAVYMQRPAGLTAGMPAKSADLFIPFRKAIFAIAGFLSASGALRLPRKRSGAQKNRPCLRRGGLRRGERPAVFTAGRVG